MRRRLIVPIYDREVILFIVRDLFKAYQRIAPRYELKAEPSDALSAGGTLICDGRFALLFQLTELDEGFVAHEVKHCADEILAFIGHKDCKCKEPNAYLLGFLQSWVKRQFREGGLKFK